MASISFLIGSSTGTLNFPGSSHTVPLFAFCCSLASARGWLGSLDFILTVKNQSNNETFKTGEVIVNNATVTVERRPCKPGESGILKRMGIDNSAKTGQDDEDEDEDEVDYPVNPSNASQNTTSSVPPTADTDTADIDALDKITTMASNFRHGAGTVNSQHMFLKEKTDPRAPPGGVPPPGALVDGKRAITTAILPTYGGRRDQPRAAEVPTEERKQNRGVPRTFLAMLESKDAAPRIKPTTAPATAKSLTSLLRQYNLPIPPSHLCGICTNLMNQPVTLPWTPDLAVSCKECIADALREIDG